jgi:hypothetical protein
VNNRNDFVIEKGRLRAYTGPGGNVIIPDEVTCIGNWAFRDKTTVTGVVLPDGLTVVDPDAFQGCIHMETIRFPDSLQEIGNAAFHNCTALKEVVLPRQMKRIGMCAFLNCAGLKRLVFPGSVERLGYNIFDGIQVLDELVIPCNPDDTEQIQFIATNLFNLDVLIRQYLNCTIQTCAPMKKALFRRLNTKPNRKKFFQTWIHQQDSAMTAKFLAVIPKMSPEELDEHIQSAEECPEIRTLFLDYKNRLYTPAELAAKEEEQAEKDLGVRERTVADWKKIYKITTEGHITGYKLSDPVAEVPHKVRNTVFEVGANAFRHCDFLERVTIAEGVTLIDKSAFNGCTRLADITIPSTLTRIGASAFKNCTALTDVSFPGGITNIGSKAFEGCEKLVIHAPAGSKIIQYAEKNGIALVEE